MGEPGASLNTYMQKPNDAADTLSRQPDKQPLGYFKWYFKTFILWQKRHWALPTNHRCHSFKHPFNCLWGFLSWFFFFLISLAASSLPHSTYFFLHPQIVSPFSPTTPQLIYILKIHFLCQASPIKNKWSFIGFYSDFSVEIPVAREELGRAYLLPPLLFP